MTTRILLTTTSYQDTPGPHHQLLESQGFEIVRERGPLPESAMLALAGDFDAFLCGDDAITRAVIEKSAPRLKVISKYGIGLDKIDVAYATELKLPVLNTPGVNHTTVAEHTFGLLLSLTNKIQENAVDVKAGKWVAGWKKPVGHEILGSTMGIIGLGRIGKEVATRAKAFGMSVIAFDPYFDEAFAAEHGVSRCATMDDVLLGANVVSLHCFLDNQNGHVTIHKNDVWPIVGEYTRDAWPRLRRCDGEFLRRRKIRMKGFEPNRFMRLVKEDPKVGHYTLLQELRPFRGPQHLLVRDSKEISVLIVVV